MPTPTFKLPTGYASVAWSIPGFTEATTTIGIAVIKAMNYENPMERLKIEGNTGFVAGWTDMMAGSAGAGGTKFDTEKLTISALLGEHASKTWPTVAGVIVISGCTGKAAQINGEWSIVKENMAFARKTEGDVGFDLERYCDVDLTP